MLLCPHCSLPLSKINGTLACPNRHSFDIAKEGYVNLLIGHERRKILGDTREMLKARREFLEKGFYQPLSDRINKLVKISAPAVVADIGCGEGYYLGRLREYLSGREIAYVGMDISKEAVRMAAKRHPGMCFAVADVWEKIPLADGSVNVLLDIFSPRNASEFARVLAPGGALVVVIPGPAHLESIREEYGLLGIEADKEEHVLGQMSPRFRLEERIAVEYDIALTGGELAVLIRMTPNWWHRADTLRERLESVPEARTKASFVILEFCFSQSPQSSQRKK